MSNGKFKLNKKGVRELLKSEEMKKVLNDAADTVMKRVGYDGYRSYVKTMPTRAAAFVRCTTHETYQDNLDNNTLLKAIGDK